eukprot:TRINITY_DN41198_c0_g1_i1.p1 TRINITY_DN41198_c0_g1~~TRINITY_DN41198_c0_g1_i1.p1  ORF type:complete len:117 (+),score=19.63 TRINITY_DN41198_c0_g1_i1:21-371(+)
MPAYNAPSGSTQNYRWANIAPGEEVEVEFDLPKGCRHRDIDVVIQAAHVRVKVMGQSLAEGDLLNRCDPEDSRWEIRGTRLVVVLVKDGGSKIPWPNVFVKDCKQTIDLDDVKNWF